MKIMNTNPAQFLEGKDIDPILSLYFNINQLKQLYRQGWMRAGCDVPEDKCESVADHIFGMAMLGLMLCDTTFPELDKTKVLTLCLLHELGEVVIGDEVVINEKPLADKYQREEAAVTELLKGFPKADEYLSLWKEFEKKETKEAQFVQELDRFERALQSKIYTLEYGVNLQEFIDNVRPRLQSKKLLDLLDQAEKI
jgi:putative hydrolase of HD superfamily